MLNETVPDLLVILGLGEAYTRERRTYKPLLYTEQKKKRRSRVTFSGWVKPS